MNRRQIVFFIVDGFQPLDLFGPLEAFAEAAGIGGRASRFRIAAPAAGKVASESGIFIHADCTLGEIAHADILLLPGGSGPRRYSLTDAERSDLCRLGQGARYSGAVCTGAFLLAQLDFARDRRLATHWQHTGELACRHSGEVDPDALFVRDGAVWSSAGITAGIDMALSMIAELDGPVVAASVARQLVVYLRRQGGQAQFSAPLAAQSGDSDRIGRAIAWASETLDRSLGVEAMAAQANMSTRHFTRLVRERMGTSPARLVERLRLDRARTLLGEGQPRIDAVAEAVGYRDVATFRRAFERAFSLTPSAYRARFATDRDLQEE